MVSSYCCDLETHDVRPIAYTRTYLLQWNQYWRSLLWEAFNSQFHYWLEDIAHGGCIINRLWENNYYLNMEAPWHQVYAIEAASYILHETQPHGCLTSSKSSHSNRKCFCPLGRTMDVTHLPVHACDCFMDVELFTRLITC